MPWGETRFGGVGTEYQYTGQYRQSAIGLDYYNARWYDPVLGRFAQADSIIPEASQGVQAWDRYAYVNNNPLRYNDPNGHRLTPYDVGGGHEKGSQEYYRALNWFELRERSNPFINGLTLNRYTYEKSGKNKLDEMTLDIYYSKGVNLNELELTQAGNPLTHEDFIEHEYPEWVYLRMITNRNSGLFAEFLVNIGLDSKKTENYEPNYLNALISNNPRQFEEAQYIYYQSLKSNTGGDEAQIFENWFWNPDLAGPDIPD